MKWEILAICTVFLFLLTPNYIAACDEDPSCTSCQTHVSLVVWPEEVHEGDTLEFSGRVTTEECYPDPLVKFYIDGYYVGSTYTDSSGYYTFTFQLPSWVGSGEHVAKAVAKIDCCEEGSDEDIFMVLTEKQTCTLRIHVRDEYGEPLPASIYIDGNYVGYDDFVEKVVSVGWHEVYVKKDGYETGKEEVYCECSETEDVYLFLERECKIKISSDLSSEPIASEWFSSTITFKNLESRGGEVSFTAFICGPEGCEEMICEGERDPVIYLSSYSLRKVECRGKVEEPCKHWIKVVYEACGKEEVYVSPTFHVFRPRCTPRFLEEYRCFGNWKQQKYVTSNCEVEWKNVEYCEKCENGECVKVEKEEKHVEFYIEPEIEVESCKINKVVLFAVNREEEEAKLKVEIKNAPPWFFLSRTLEVKPGEQKEVPIFVEVPCDAKGNYGFEVWISGDVEEVLVSSLAVKQKDWALWITGMFKEMGSWIIGLVTLFLIALFLWMVPKKRKYCYECFGDEC